MPEKILKIFFSGISTMSPGPPPKGAAMPDKTFVLMAANRKAKTNDWGATVEEHSVYLFAPMSIVENAGTFETKPGGVAQNDKLGECFVYFLDHAHVVVDGTPSRGISYYVEEKAMAERPGSIDVASENDIRWLADFRDIVPADQAKLKAAVNPAAGNVSDDVAVVVELTGGTWKASFPCKTVQSQTFKDVAGKIVTVKGADGKDKPFKRVFANEFFIEIPFAEDVERVKLQLKSLRQDPPPTGFGQANELVLQWPVNENTIEVHMGNDTRDEAFLVSSTQRCDIRVLRGARPVLVPRDDDFFLHYQIIDVPGGAGPLPQNGPQQTHFNGCIPGATGG